MYPSFSKYSIEQFSHLSVPKVSDSIIIAQKFSVESRISGNLIIKLWSLGVIISSIGSLSKNGAWLINEKNS